MFLDLKCFMVLENSDKVKTKVDIKIRNLLTDVKISAIVRHIFDETAKLRIQYRKTLLLVTVDWANNSC